MDASAQTCAIPLYHDYQEAIPDSFDPIRFEMQVEDTIRRFGLFTKESKVLVAASGGKDSTVLLHVLVRLGYRVEAVTVDAHIGCYTEENLRNLRSVCSSLGVTLHEISFREEFGRSLCYIQSILKTKGYDYKSCHTCGVLRRYLLNKYARKIKPDVIATGHNLDDEAQAFLMNLLRNQLALAARMGPKSGIVKDARFILRVKPLYFAHERDVIFYSRHHGFPVHYGECPCSSDAYRREMKNVFLALGQEREGIKENLIASFLSIKDDLMRAHYSDDKIGACDICGEPAAHDICNVCAIKSKITEGSA